MSDLKVLCPCLDNSKSDLFNNYFVIKFKVLKFFQDCQEHLKILCVFTTNSLRQTTAYLSLH